MAYTDGRRRSPRTATTRRHLRYNLSLTNRRSWLQNHKEEIAEKIERAFERFGRGEFLSAEESRAEMEKRKAAWLGEQKPRWLRSSREAGPRFERLGRSRPPVRGPALPGCRDELAGESACPTIGERLRNVGTQGHKKFYAAAGTI